MRTHSPTHTLCILLAMGICLGLSGHAYADTCEAVVAPPPPADCGIQSLCEDGIVIPPIIIDIITIISGGN
jgi:hypothetical protein